MEEIPYSDDDGVEEEDDILDEGAGGYATDAGTDYGTDFDGDSDFVTDEDEPFDDFLDAPNLISHLNVGVSEQGPQPYEIFREERRQAREQRLQQARVTTAAPASAAGPSGSAQLHQAVQDPEAAARESSDEQDKSDHDAAAKHTGRRRRRSHGQGRRARRRKPTHISRGMLPPQGIDLMKQANLALISGDSSSAIEPLMECIKAYPNFTEPYTSLAAAFADMGLNKQALNCYSIAAHMKPSDSQIALDCAKLSMDAGFYKQAIWSWSKYIRLNRQDRSAHVQRLQAYSHYLEQQEAAGRNFTRVARMARTAVQSTLETFPGDPAAATKMPWFLYKLGQPDQAVKFLAEFIAKYPARVDPTHVNMLAQLHMEKKDYAQAVRVITSTTDADTCKGFIDLAVKLGVCKLHLGDLVAAMDYLSLLFAEPPDEFHDLYLEVAHAFLETNQSRQATPLCERYLDGMAACLAATQPADAAGGDANNAGDNSTRAARVAELVEMLPCVQSCCSTVEDNSMLLRAYELLHMYMPRDAPEYVEYMLKMVGLLLASGDEAQSCAARDLMAELDAAAGAGKDTFASLEVQTRRGEALLQTRDHETFVSTMCAFLEAEVEQEAVSRAYVERAMKDLPPEVRRRVERIQRGTLGPSSLAPGDAGTPRGPEDVDAILAAQPALSNLRPQGKKDRRKDAIKELDRLAHEYIAQHAHDAELERMREGRSRLRRILEHPTLFPMLLQALGEKTRQGECKWVRRQVKALLHHHPRRMSDQQRRNKAALLMLNLLCRTELDELHLITAVEQKHVFVQWPYSVRAWNLFCRWSQKVGSMPTRLVARLQEQHPDSLPLQLLRGHALLVSGHYATALQHYFRALAMLPEDPVINLCIGAAYLQHATSKRVGDRHACILKAFAFFSRYAAFATNKQEAAFNLGRAMHHLGLNHLAVDWYERALVLSHDQLSAAVDVRFEAAHNLALIYEGSGATALALRVRRLYCTV